MKNKYNAPWTLDVQYNEVYDCNNNEVATLKYLGMSDQDTENAKLITHAPMMLMMIENLTNIITDLAEPDVDDLGELCGGLSAGQSKALRLAEVFLKEFGPSFKKDKGD